MLRMWIALLGASVALGACASKEDRIKRHLERAESYMEDAWEPEAAQLELRAALGLDPQNADTNYKLGLVLEQMEKWDDALFYYEEARRLEPSSDDAALAVAHLIRLHDPDRATSLIDEVLARSPGTATAHVLRSDVFLVRKDVPNALASALTATELDPKNTRAFLQVGGVYKASIRQRMHTEGETVDPKLFEQADAALARAFELADEDPQHAWTVRIVEERAEVLTAWKGHGPEVVRLFHESFEKLKDARRPSIRIANLAAAQARGAGDDELLYWALDHLVKLTPAVTENWVELARLADARGEDGAALMKRMADERDEDAQAQIAYAEFLSSRGQNADAIVHLERVLPASSAPDATLVELVSLHLAAYDLERASLALERLRSEHAESPKTNQAEAMLALYEGRVADAIAALEAWTGEQETPGGFAMLADARLRAGRPRDALDAIDRALALSNQPRPGLDRLRGRILVRLGDHRSALNAFSRARSQGGVAPIPFVPDVAAALYGVGNHGEARRVLERALAEAQPPQEALLLFARQEFRRDLKAARVAMEKGAELYPRSLDFVVMLVTADLREGQQEAALARAKAAAEEYEDFPPAVMLLAQTQVNVGRTDDAVKTVEVVQQRWPDQVGVAELYLTVMTRAGRGDDAFRSLTRDHESGRLSPHGRVLLARLYTARGDDEKAIELLRSALAELQSLPAAENDLAYALARRGEQLQEATELAQDARANRPESSEIADTLGYVYLRRDLAEAALVQFDAALELAPAGSTGWATAQYHRGLALQKLGRGPEALTALEQALASGADFAEVKEAQKVLAELAKSPADQAAREGS